VSGRAERREARADVSAYHEAQFASLVSMVGAAADRFRAGDLGAFEVDEMLLSILARRRNCGRSAA